MNHSAVVLFLVAVIGALAFSAPCNQKNQNENLAAEMTQASAVTAAPKTWSAMPAPNSETLKTEATKYVADQLAGKGYKEFQPTATTPTPGLLVHLMVKVSPQTLATFLFSVKMDGADVVPGKEVILGIPQFTAINAYVSRTMSADEVGTVGIADANKAINDGLGYFIKTIYADPAVKLILDENLGDSPKIAYARDLIEGSYAGVQGTYIHFVFWCTK